MATSPTSQPNIENNDKKSQPEHQWAEIRNVSSFTSKWNLFSSLNTSFGNVSKVSINRDKKIAKILFSNIESAQKCCTFYTSNRLLDGELIYIDLCTDQNITQRNAKRYSGILAKKLNGINDTSIIEKIKFCAENLDKLTPVHIAKFHAKILRLLSSNSEDEHNHKQNAIFVTVAFSIIGVDSYIFSDHFNGVNAITLNDTFYANLVWNIKLFGRFGTPIKCLNGNFLNCYANIAQQQIIYIDSFNLQQGMKWSECVADISYNHNSSTCYLSNLCNEIYTKSKQLMLIAVKVPKHFMVSEFEQKLNECHVIVFDFKFHQFMVLDFVHNMSELRALEFKCRDKKHEFGFYKTFLFESNFAKSPPNKKRKLSQIPLKKVQIENEIASNVRNKLREIGFMCFGAEHYRNFKQKLKRQIISKQMIREMITEIDLKSPFNEIKEIAINNDKANVDWIAPHLVAPRYLIYATSQWIILVDEHKNMCYHPHFNSFYLKIFGAKTVSIIDGYLMINNNVKEREICPLQFWILDVLSYENNTCIQLKDRFGFFQNIVAKYKRECKYLRSGPISIRSLHFEAHQNINNLLKFIKVNGDKKEIVYQNSEGDNYVMDGFVVIKNNAACTVHDRKKYNDRCVLWRADFNALLTHYFVTKRKQTQNTIMFQNNTDSPNKH